MAVSRTLFSVGCIVFAESLASTLLFPFVYFMVRDFGLADERLIGSRAGLITSAFFVGQILTTALWGHISDKYGRKPVLLSGLLGSAASMLVFGLSKSLAWAIISRGFCGLLNGNIAVARTTVGELAEKQALKQSKAFSLFGFCGALGYLIGPVIGGWLANPAVSLGISGPRELFRRHPYLLPCLISVVFNCCVFLTCLCFLDETFQAGPYIEGTEDDTEATETEQLLHASHTDHNDQHIEPEHPGQYPRSRSRSSVVVCVVATSCICFHAIIFDEAYTLFTASSLQKGTGLGFSSRDIANSLSLMGPVIFIVQLFGYPLLNAHCNTLNLWLISSAVFTVNYPLYSLLPRVADSSIRWTILLVFLTMRFAFIVVGYTSLNILVNHIVEPTRRGFVNGMVQSAASLSRAVGPALGGAIWSWSLGSEMPFPFDSRALLWVQFALLSLLSVVQGATSWWIPRSAASKD